MLEVSDAGRRSARDRIFAHRAPSTHSRARSAYARRRDWASGRSGGCHEVEVLAQPATSAYRMATSSRGRWDAGSTALLLQPLAPLYRPFEIRLATG